MPRALVALNLPKRISDTITYAQSIAAALRGNPFFPSPIPSITEFQADVDALERSHVRTLTRAAGTVAEQHAQLMKVKHDLSCLRTYVQHVAEATPGEALVVIASAGMSLKRSSGRARPLFTAKPGPNPGTARLAAKAPGTRASYDWQQSVDGSLWVDLPRTVRADAVVTALVAGTTYFFRFRTLTKEGVGDWSQVLSLFIV